MTLDTLPTELREGVLAFLDHDALHAVELTSHSLAATLASATTWEQLARRGLRVGEEDTPRDAKGWKFLGCMLRRPNAGYRKLLASVVGCSSMDREEESPHNTLELSPCWRTISTHSRRANSLFARALLQLTQMDHQQVAQAECGCYGGTACYWSTTGSREPKTEDFIDYTVKPRSRVNLVEIIPYCAHWQPNHPTYGPVAVSFVFYNCPSETPADESTRTLVYESPEYPLTNDMKLHQCVLPVPVWLPHGGVMRLRMHGRYQNGTFENDTEFFYTTLSYVGAGGFRDGPPE